MTKVGEETNAMRRIMLRLGSMPGIRLFRNNTGAAWIGSSTRFTKRQQIWVNHGDVLVQNARYFEAGLCKGSSDVIGIKSVTVTPEMVGTLVAIFVAIEVKNAKGRKSEEQINFINMVSSLGGIAKFTDDENVEI